MFVKQLEPVRVRDVFCLGRTVIILLASFWDSLVCDFPRTPHTWLISLMKTTTMWWRHRLCLVSFILSRNKYINVVLSLYLWINVLPRFNLYKCVSPQSADKYGGRVSLTVSTQHYVQTVHKARPLSSRWKRTCDTACIRIMSICSCVSNMGSTSSHTKTSNVPHVSFEKKIKHRTQVFQKHTPTG